MGVLIDASILIDAERGRLDLAARVAELPDEEAFLSVITASELLHGVHRAAQTEQRTRRAASVEALLQRLPVLDVDLPTARTPAPRQISRPPIYASGLTTCGWPQPASPTASPSPPRTSASSPAYQVFASRPGATIENPPSRR